MSIRPVKGRIDCYDITVCVPLELQDKYGDRVRRRVEGSKLYASMVENDIRKELGKVNSTDNIEAIAEKYLAWVKINQRPKTYSDKERSLRAYIVPFFGRLFPDRISLQTIDAYKEKRKADPQAKGHNYLRNRAINLELLCLGSMVKWAKARKLCFNALCEYEELEYIRPRIDPLAKEEVDAIINALSPEHKGMLLFLYHAGLRKSELFNLKWGNINPHTKLIMVTGKRGKQRNLPLSGPLAAFLADRLQTLGRVEINSLVFPSPKTGKPYTSIKTALKGAKKRAGVMKRIYPHLFRHSFASHLVPHANIRVIQELLGHADVQTTQIYAHTNPEQAKLIEGVFK